MITPNKARQNFPERGQIRQFLPHFFELCPFLPRLSSDFGTNKAIIALLGVALYTVTTVVKQESVFLDPYLLKVK